MNPRSLAAQSVFKTASSTNRICAIFSCCKFCNRVNYPNYYPNIQNFEITGDVGFEPTQYSFKDCRTAVILIPFTLHEGTAPSLPFSRPLFSKQAQYFSVNAAYGTGETRTLIALFATYPASNRVLYQLRHRSGLRFSFYPFFCFLSFFTC